MNRSEPRPPTPAQLRYAWRLARAAGYPDPYAAARAWSRRNPLKHRYDWSQLIDWLQRQAPNKPYFD